MIFFARMKATELYDMSVCEFSCIGMSGFVSIFDRVDVRSFFNVWTEATSMLPIAPLEIYELYWAACINMVVGFAMVVIGFVDGLYEY